MSLRFLFVALLLHVTYVLSNRCPTSSQMGPCKCLDTPWGLEIFCNDILVGEIRDTLENVARTKEHIFDMKLQDVWLPNLPPNLLQVHDIDWLTIQNCSTSSVDKDAFADMAATLNTLYLTYNDLERVPSEALEKCLKLERLYLDNNRIEIVHAEAFLGLDSLMDLSLGGNRIKFIDDSAFVGIGEQFEELDLSRNELTAVPCVPLRNLRSLDIDLRNNKIATLLPEVCGAVGGESLGNLDLANNTIGHLPARVFGSTKVLSTLDVSWNGFDSISPTAFAGTEDTLFGLSLGYNRLEEVPSTVLKNMRVLSSINLSGNRIFKIRKDDFLTYGGSIIIIDLRDNSLEYIDSKAFTGLHSLIVLWLGSNQLKTFAFETFAPVTNTLGLLDILDNPLHCDCHLSWMKGRKSWFIMKNEEITCVTPEKYANVSLAKIEIDELVCDNKTSNSPEPCCKCFSSTPESVSSTTLENVSSSTPESVSNSILESVSSTTAESVSNSTPKSVFSNTSESVSSSTQERVSSSAPESVSNNTPESVSNSTPESVSNTTPDSASTSTPEKVSSSTAESASNNSPESVSSKTQHRVSNNALMSILQLSYMYI